MLSDVVQMPLNPLDSGFRSFENNVLPVANKRGVAVGCTFLPDHTIL